MVVTEKIINFVFEHFHFSMLFLRKEIRTDFEKMWGVKIVKSGAFGPVGRQNACRVWSLRGLLVGHYTWCIRVE